MKPAAAQGALFDTVPDLRHVENMLSDFEGLRNQLLGGVADCNRELRRLSALAHALREFAGDPAGAAVAVRLAEKGWSGTGEQLVTVACAVTAQAGTS